MPITLEQFERNQVGNAAFRHEDHVRVAWEMLGRHEFDVALTRYAAGLRRIACAAGQPDKFHLTLTVAFLAAIAERRYQAPDLAWEAFVERYPELLSRGFLERWYSPAQLATDVARRVFVLPGPASR